MTTDEVALFVIEQKALVHAQHPAMSEDHIKDEVMMRLARELLAARIAAGKGVNWKAEWEATSSLNIRFEAALSEIAEHPTGGVGCSPTTLVAIARTALEHGSAHPEEKPC